MSVGTVTTYRYCVTKDGKAYIGTKEEIVEKLCMVSWIDKKRTLFAKFNGYPEKQYHSYKSEYTVDEMKKDAIQTIFDSLKDFGYETFRDIGF